MGKPKTDGVLGLSPALVRAVALYRGRMSVLAFASFVGALLEAFFLVIVTVRCQPQNEPSCSRL